MYSSKLLRLLQTLSNKELQQFHLLISNKIISVSSDALELCEFLKGNRRRGDFVEEKIEKERVFEQLFLKSNDADKSLRDAKSSLKKGVEQFIVWKEVAGNKHTQQSILPGALLERGLENEFNFETKAALSKLKNSKTAKGDLHYREHFTLHRALYFSPIGDTIQHSAEALKLALVNLDKDHVLSKLSIVCELLNRSLCMGEDFQIVDFQQAIDQGKGYAGKGIAFFSIYLSIINLHVEEFNRGDFLAAIEAFEKAADEIALDRSSLIFQYFLNIITRATSKGNEHLLDDSFTLYKIGLSKKMFFTKDFIPSRIYLNIITNAGALKEFKWLTNFQKDYSKYLIPAESKKTIKQGNILSLFYQDKFQKVIASINELDLPNNFYSFRFKAILLRSLYELSQTDVNYWDMLFSQLENVYRYLKKPRNASRYKVEGMQNFVHELKKISTQRRNLKGYSLKQKEACRERINAYQEIIMRRWLLEKIEEL